MSSTKLFEAYVEIGVDLTKFTAGLAQVRAMLASLGTGPAAGAFTQGVSAGVASGMIQGLTRSAGQASTVVSQAASQGMAQGVAQGVTRASGQARNALGQFVAQGVAQGMAQGTAQGTTAWRGQARNALGQFTSAGGGGGGGFFGGGGLLGLSGLGGMGGMAGQGLTGLGMGLGLPFAMNPAMMAGQMIGSGLRDAVGSAMQLEGQFVDLQRVSGKTAENVGDFKKTIFEIAKTQAGASVQDLIEISSAGAKMGITDKEGMAGLETFTRAMARVRNVVSGMGTEQLANDTGRMLNLFHKGTDYVESFGSALVRMDNVSTSSAADILDMSKNLSGTFQSLNMTIPQVLAFSSVLADVGLTNAQGASSFSQILRMMASQSEKFAEAIGMPVDEFQKAIRTNAMDALGMLIAKFRELNEVDPIKAQEFLVSLGFRGVKTAGALQQLSSMFEQVQERTAMAVEEESTLGSLIAGNELSSNKASSAVQKLQNAFTELGDAIGKHLLKPITEFAGIAQRAINQAAAHLEGEDTGKPAGPEFSDMNRTEMIVLQGLKFVGMANRGDEIRLAQLQKMKEDAYAAQHGLALEAGPATPEEMKAQRDRADPAAAKRAEESGKRMAAAADEGFKSVFTPGIAGDLFSGIMKGATDKAAVDSIAMIRDPNMLGMAHPSWGRPTDVQIKGETIEEKNLFKSETFTDPAAFASKAIETALSDKDPKIAERQLKVQEKANEFLKTIADNLKIPAPFAPATNTGMLIMKGNEETVTAP